MNRSRNPVVYGSSPTLLSALKEAREALEECASNCFPGGIWTFETMLEYKKYIARTALDRIRGDGGVSIHPGTTPDQTVLHWSEWLPESHDDSATDLPLLVYLRDGRKRDAGEFVVATFDGYAWWTPTGRRLHAVTHFTHLPKRPPPAWDRNAGSSAKRSQQHSPG